VDLNQARKTIDAIDAIVTAGRALQSLADDLDKQPAQLVRHELELILTEMEQKRTSDTVFVSFIESARATIIMKV
jgi:hypothetical protein